MKQLSLALFVHLFAATILFGATPEQSKTTVLKALDFFQTGNYSCDMLEEPSDYPAYTVKLLHIVSEQEGEMMRGDFYNHSFLFRSGKFSLIKDGKVYDIRLEDRQHNAIIVFRTVVSLFQAMLETFPCEFHQTTVKGDGNQPAFRITVSLPTVYTQEQLDTVHRFLPEVPQDFAIAKLVFTIGKKNGFWYGLEIYTPNGKLDEKMTFSNVKINPEWNLSDFTPPEELKTVKIDTEKKFEKELKPKPEQPARRSRRSHSFGDFWMIHRDQIWAVVIAVFRYAGILLLLAGVVVYLRQKRH